MKSLFRVVRYSAVGASLAGVVSAVVGCSSEDQLRALLLFLLLLFGGGGEGGGEDAPAPIPVCTDGATVACAIDLYTNARSLSSDCDSGNVSAADANGDFIYEDRDITIPGPPGGLSGDVSISVGAVSFTKNNAALAGQSCGPFFTYSGPGATTFDFSAFSKVEYEVLSASGSFASPCLFELRQIAFATTDSTNLDFPSTGFKSIALNLANTSGLLIDEVALGNCGAFDPSSGFTISPLVLVP